ncbi:MAG TPA: O-antigen ligase family protein [Terriglobales bacterium]|nr:O-antigen ligase family protein [Terriglobales bacterium]
MNAVLNSALAAPLEARGIRNSPRSKLQPIVFYGTFALLLFGPLAFGAVDPWAIFLIESGSAALLLVWVLQQIQQQELRITPNPVFAPMCAFAILIAFQYLAHLTAYRYATSTAMLLLCAQGLLCFLAVQTLHRTPQANRLAIIFSAYGFSLACFAILQSLSSTGKIYWYREPHGGWPYGPYVNHNHYAGLMELLVPIPLVLSLTHFVHGRTKAVAAFAAAVMAASIFLSGSRGGMAALAVQMALLTTILIRRKAKARNTALAIALFAVVMVGVLAWIGGGDLTRRMSTIHSDARAEISGGTRMNIDRDGIRMFARKPILGWGLATFPEVFPQFRTFYTDFYVNAAHNDYLQLLTETGILGFGTMIWLLMATYRGAVRKLANWPSDTNGAVALAAIIAVTGLLVHSLVDFNLQIPANATLFYVLCAIAAMDPQFGRSRRRSRTDPITEMVTH